MISKLHTFHSLMPLEPPQMSAYGIRRYATVPHFNVVNRARRWPIFGGLGMAAVLGYYSMVLLNNTSSPTHFPSDATAVPTGRPSPVSNMSALDFDHSLDSTESWSGILTLRQRMSKLAKGDVLEVAVGTGRNIKYFNWLPLAPRTPSDILKVRGRPTVMTSYTGVDISTDMLDVTIDRIRSAAELEGEPTVQVYVCPDTERKAGALEYLCGKIRVIKTDIQSFIPLAPGARKYDRIFQTFGLCSVSHPKEVLMKLASLTQPETGRIILLEHGKGSYGIVNNLLDRSAPSHFSRFGCWWNRDIENIVRSAADEIPGLTITKIEKPWFQLGTLYWIELRVTQPEQGKK